LRSCPADAIIEHKGEPAGETGVKELKEAPAKVKEKKKKAKTICTINADTCVRCGICLANCPTGAVFKRDRSLTGNQYAIGGMQ
jgi:ferredoxin